MAERLKLLFYSESHQPGGSDRFVTDLLRGLDSDAFELMLAGNRSAAVETWLRRELPEAPPRHAVPIATLESPRLGRLLRRIPGHPGTVHAEDPERTDSAPVSRPASPVPQPAAAPLALRAASASARLQQAAINRRRLRRLFRRLSPDVVHINNGGYPGAESCRMAALAARDVGAGVVHCVHNMPYPPAWPPALERRLDAVTDAATDAWVTPARRATRALASLRGLPPAKIHTVHCGVAVPPAPARPDPLLASALDLPEGRRVLTVVASFEERKGHLQLLEALAALAGDARPVTLLAGDGERRSLLERHARRLGVADDVRFLGWRDDVRAILALSDVFALPSVANECLPYSILEAMAEGLPVVSTDVAGIPEMVLDGITGRLVPPGDVAALSAAIAQLTRDRDLARRLGAQARAHVAGEFSLAQTTQRMSELYLSAHPAHGRRPVALQA